LKGNDNIIPFENNIFIGNSENEELDNYYENFYN